MQQVISVPRPVRPPIVVTDDDYRPLPADLDLLDTGAMDASLRALEAIVGVVQ